MSLTYNTRRYIINEKCPTFVLSLTQGLLYFKLDNIIHKVICKLNILLIDLGQNVPIFSLIPAAGPATPGGPAYVVTLYVANATICRKRHYVSQKTPLYVANATICRNMQHYMSQTPLYVAKNATICRKVKDSN